jgi:hypothetical protein
MLPQWATRAFRSSESYQHRERLQSMLGCPLVQTVQNWALLGQLRYIKKSPVYCPTFRFNPVGSPYQSRKEADQVVLPPLNSDWPDGEWPISLTERTVPTAIVKSNTGFGG